MATKKRLIDANEFEEAHCNGCPYRLEGSCTNDDPICATIADLRDAPTVDAVEVVRCKECKRWRPWSDRTQGFCPCSEHVTQASHFCSYGERRTENG